jgi:hypothetical protein
MFFTVMARGDSLNNAPFLTLAHVEDGTSNVIFVGEVATRVGSIQYFAATWLGVGIPGAMADGPIGEQSVTNGTSGARNTMGIHRALRRAKWDIELNTARLTNANKAFSSNHTGGGSFVLGDGSVRFIADTISGSVYDVLPMRNSGQTKSF